MYFFGLACSKGKMSQRSNQQRADGRIHLVNLISFRCGSLIPVNDDTVEDLRDAIQVYLGLCAKYEIPHDEVESSLRAGRVK